GALPRLADEPPRPAERGASREGARHVPGRARDRHARCGARGSDDDGDVGPLSARRSREVDDDVWRSVANVDRSATVGAYASRAVANVDPTREVTHDLPASASMPPAC